MTYAVVFGILGVVAAAGLVGYRLGGRRVPILLRDIESLTRAWGRARDRVANLEVTVKVLRARARAAREGHHEDIVEDGDTGRAVDEFNRVFGGKQSPGD